MKISSVLMLLLPLGVPLLSSDAWAGATANAGTCYEFAETGMMRRGSNGIINYDAVSQTVICPIPVDHTIPAVGSTVTFRVYMFDNNSTSGANISCTGFAYNQNSGQVGMTAAMTSGSGTATFTGVRTATATLSATANTHTYVVQCTIPGGAASGINNVRVS